MNTFKRQPTTRRPVSNFLDVAAIIGKQAAAEIREAVTELESLRQRAAAYTPQAANTDFDKEREAMIADGPLTDDEIERLGTRESWEKQYAQSSGMLNEAAQRRHAASFKRFRPLYRKLETALQALHDSHAAAEGALATRAGIEYSPSSGTLSISDTIAVMALRIAAADEHPDAAPSLKEYFGSAIDK